jgi:signal transduction histidine kinase
LICVAGSLFVIYELLKPAKKEYRLAYILVSVVFGISGITSLYRALAILVLRPEEAHIPISANLVFYFMASITQALLMFSFLLLISIKITVRLEHKVQTQRKFYSIIAHDLSGPVGMINAMLNMIGKDEDLDEQRKTKIYGEVENLSSSTYHLLQNLLYWSRNQLEDLRPNIKKFDLDNLIQNNIELMSQLAKTKKLEIVYEPNPALNCKADVRMIDTVIRNLISNAIKFSHANDKIEINCQFNGTFVILRVTDHGIGMPEDMQKHLYRFNGNNPGMGTRGERGSGLGLVLCKEFIEGNGGSIQIFSKENEGTEVTVTIPSA